MRNKRELTHEDFFWWNNKISRPTMMIFWGSIIPLLFILKYVLHVF